MTTSTNHSVPASTVPIGMRRLVNPGCGNGPFLEATVVSRAGPWKLDLEVRVHRRGGSGALVDRRRVPAGVFLEGVAAQRRRHARFEGEARATYLAFSEA